MKKIFSFIISVFFFVHTEAQVDHSGNYGFQLKVYYDKHSPLKPTRDEADRGKRGDLTLFKIDADKYKFWLSVNRGWPSYSQGNITGIIELKEDNAEYREKQEFADSSCVILFAFDKHYIEIEQRSSHSDCGFGFSVLADGKYKKNDTRKLRNSDLEKYYKDFTKYMITGDKVFLYEDGTGNNRKMEYFGKEDIVISTTANENYVYVEYITTSGGFIYGWLKKSEVKAIE